MGIQPRFKHAKSSDITSNRKTHIFSIAKGSIENVNLSGNPGTDLYEAQHRTFKRLPILLKRCCCPVIIISRVLKTIIQFTRTLNNVEIDLGKNQVATLLIWYAHLEPRATCLRPFASAVDLWTQSRSNFWGATQSPLIRDSGNALFHCSGQLKFDWSIEFANLLKAVLIFAEKTKLLPFRRTIPAIFNFQCSKTKS